MISDPQAYPRIGAQIVVRVGEDLYSVDPMPMPLDQIEGMKLHSPFPEGWVGIGDLILVGWEIVQVEFTTSYGAVVTRGAVSTTRCQVPKPGLPIFRILGPCE